MTIETGLIKQKLDDWLNQVDYASLNSSTYIPTTFALTFMNWIKMVNGQEGKATRPHQST